MKKAVSFHCTAQWAPVIFFIMMYLYVVYENPSDYPGYLILRRWTIGKGWYVPDTQPLIMSKDYQVILDYCHSLGLCKLLPDPTDDPVIKEIWL